MADNLGMVESTQSADNLMAGDGAKYKDVTILAGAGALVKGTVLGKVTKGTVTITAGTNTGNGAAGAITRGAKTKVGNYTLRCITAATNGGTFAVFDPDGYRLDDLKVTVAYSNGHFGVTIADGTTDFIVGDTFTVAVPAGSGKFVAYDADNTDGSQVADCILARASDASGASDQKAFAIDFGEVRRAELTGIDDAGAAQLEAKNIYMR